MFLPAQSGSSAVGGAVESRGMDVGGEERRMQGVSAAAAAAAADLSDPVKKMSHSGRYIIHTLHNSIM